MAESSLVNDWLRVKFDRHPIAVSLWVLLALIGLAAVLRNALQWIGVFDLMMHKGVVFNKPGSLDFHVEGWLFWIFGGLIALAAVSLAVLIQREFKLSEVKAKLVSVARDKDERSTVAFKTLQRTMWIATKIRDQHQPLGAKVRKCYRSYEAEYRISKAFDVEFTNKSQIYATAEPVNFYTVSVIAQSAATPMEYLDDINFKMWDDSGKDVVYQQTENDPRAKKVIVYPIPRIETGEAEPRLICSAYKWPGLFAQLKTLRAEPFSWAAESLSEIEKIQFTFLFEKGSGEELVCKVLSGGKVQSVPATQDGNWTGQVFSIEKVPAGKCQVELVLRLKAA